MPWLLPSIYYATAEERSKALAEAESLGHRLVNDEHNVGDREKPHRLTFEAGHQRSTQEEHRTTSSDGASSGKSTRLPELTSKLREGSASLQEVIEYLCLRDRLR